MEIGSLQAGNVRAGNYTEVMVDGTIRQYGEATEYDDMLCQAIGNGIDTSTGRLSYDYTEGTIDYATNARYTDEPVFFAFQMSHRQKDSSNVFFHIHWLQDAAGSPNWLLRYRTVANGSAASAYTNVALVSNLFTYTAGTILQITTFGSIQAAPGVSNCVDCILYRDSANASGLFAGADTYPNAGKVKFADLHFQVDSLGSNTEYSKA